MIILVSLIFCLAGFAQGLTGFGAALVAIPFLCFIMDVRMAVPLTILVGAVINTYMVTILRHHLDLKKITPLFIGSVPGVLLGVVLLKEINQDIMKQILGVFLISYSTYNLLYSPKPLNPSKVWAYFAGFLTGVITAALSAGGPPTIIYTTLTDWEKNVIKATLAGFFAINGYFALVAQAATGIITLSILKLFVFTLPCVLLGTALGSKYADKVNRQTYLRIVYLFLAAMGLMMSVG